MSKYEHYEIPIENSNNISHVADDILQRIRSGEIWFPFHKNYLGNPPDLFENLKNIDLPVEHKPYTLYSYYPKYLSFVPSDFQNNRKTPTDDNSPKFRGSPTTISGSKDTYKLADVISDHFIEEPRLNTKRHDQSRSILECWNNDECLKDMLSAIIPKTNTINPDVLRQMFYDYGETKIFNPTWAKALLKLGEYVIIETPPKEDTKAYGKKFLGDIVDFIESYNPMIIAKTKRVHTNSNLFANMYLIKNNNYSTQARESIKYRKNHEKDY